MLRIKVLVTVVLGVVVLLMLIIIPVIDPFRKHFEQDIARNDMETLRSIILQYAEDHEGLIPAFDTASPPDWYKEIKQFPYDEPAEERMHEIASRKWHYIVVPAMVGKKWSQESDSDPVLLKSSPTSENGYICTMTTFGMYRYRNYAESDP